MRSILDSHALLRFYLGDPSLSPAALSAILDSTRIKSVSPASFWEIAIKVSLGKYALNEPYDDFIQHAIYDNRVRKSSPSSPGMRRPSSPCRTITKTPSTD